MIEMEETVNLYRDEFETVFGMKKNIEVLRNKVLNLAIQGKLVEQDPNDEPASRLKERIRIEKQELISSNKIRKIKTLGEIDNNDIPFNTPSNWEWERLNEVLDVRDGTHDTPKYVKKGIPLITSKNLKKGEIDYSNIKYISKEDHEEISKRSTVDDSDILLAMIGSIGNAVLVKKDREFSIKNIALFKNYPNKSMNMEYMKYFFDAVETKLKGDASGGVQTFLSLTYFRNLLVPIPPISEQKRIVVRLNKLMTAIDNLEEQLEEKEKLETLIPKAVVNTLSNSQNEEKLKKNLKLIIEYFTEVFQTSESLDEFRKVILHLGIQGKLLPQCLTDEPVEKVMNRIIEEKEELIKEGKINKEKPHSKVKTHEIPFKIPDTWMWTKLGVITNFASHTSVTPSEIDDDDRLYELGDIEKSSGRLIQKMSMKERQSKSNKYVVNQGDILYGKLRPYLNKVTIAPESGYCSTEIFPLKLYGGQEKRYLQYYLRSEYFVNYAISNSQGTKMPRLGSTFGKRALVPLPPLEEQKRIVAKIESLFAVVDQLEEEMQRRESIVEAMAVI